MAANASFLPSKTGPGKPALPFVFESNLRVLNYLKRTFSALYDLRSFPKSGLSCATWKPCIGPAWFCWPGTAYPSPCLYSHRSVARGRRFRVLILATVAEMADYEAFARLGAIASC